MLNGSTHMTIEMIMFRNIQETMDVQYRSVHATTIYGNFLVKLSTNSFILLSSCLVTVLRFSLCLYA